MPGHPIPNNPSSIQKAQADVAKLEQLIDQHDAIFLLMDSRESRWLPTVVSAAKNKVRASSFSSILLFHPSSVYIIFRLSLMPPSGSTLSLSCAMVHVLLRLASDVTTAMTSSHPQTYVSQTFALMTQPYSPRSIISLLQIELWIKCARSHALG